MEFNEDGSLKIGKNFHNPKSTESSDFFEEEKPSLLVLKLLSEVSFPIGRKLISETLRGENNLKLRKLRLNLCEMFGALDLYSDRDVYRLIDDLAFDGFVEITKTRYSKFYPVVIITDKGKKELDNPSLVSKNGEKYVSTGKLETMVPPSPVTEEDKRLFSAFGDFLSGYNEEQKKAIIESGKRILCIAGAGSGKTSVLSKRIEFLVRLKGVDPKKILAITFTRKARQEMISRIGISEVSIETFNSFCEKVLRRNERKLFQENYSVIDFRRKINLFNEALSRLKYT
ncbi:MAG: UvrD-helicase domain-containing protein, partial [Nanoarchaeota archaeon]